MSGRFLPYSLLVLAGALLVSGYLVSTGFFSGGALPHSERPTPGAEATLYLYAVTADGVVETYSPLRGQIRSFGKVTQTGAQAQQTLTGTPAACLKLVGSSTQPGDPATLPFLYWIDLQGSEQQQFFIDALVVYVCDQPLVENQDGMLESVPQPSAQP